MKTLSHEDLEKTLAQKESRFFCFIGGNMKEYPDQKMALEFYEKGEQKTLAEWIDDLERLKALKELTKVSQELGLYDEIKR
jgi:hypothetical protein